MTSKRALILFFIAVVVYGALGGYFASVNAPLPKPLELLFTIGLAVLVYVWYYLDAAERRYKRSVLLGGAVIVLSVVAVPYYLVRSRPKGQRIKALLGFVGFLVLAVILFVGAGLPFMVGVP
ncbi:hypothetical protein LRH25_06280 [Ideonella azotifigens]|uniref:Uncharacterized protein n=1 Tax=Ideonella azotifigens TaxID=513160 RepID=A0ABN1JNL1_9BURK|nr:hypothetical protein [Ideonella azotifigens]MCD2339945.1 hypothetical protein [Ideonella azotifigens]